MPQAKTLSEKELRAVLARLAIGPHPARNRTAILLSTWGGMRVGEIAAIKVADVLNVDGTIKSEIRLSSDQTKGNKGRVVIVGNKLQRELASYIKATKFNDSNAPLIGSQRNRNGFSGNTLCQMMRIWYHRAGIAGATSHSGRRTFITTLANKGVGVRVLMALAGHKHMSTTQRYIDLNDEMMRRAIDLI